MRTDLFRLMVEASADGLWILDEHGATIYASPRMAELLGRDLADLDGFSAFDALDEAGHEDMRRHLADMVERPPGRGGPRDEAGPSRRQRAVDPRQLDRAARRRRRADGLAAPGRGVHRPPSARRHPPRARAAAGDRPEHREDRQLGVGRRRATRSPGPTSSTASTTWSRRSSRRRYQASWSSCTRTTGRWSRRSLVSTFAGADDFRFDARIIRAGGEQRWVRGLGVVQRAPDGTPGGDGRHRPGHHRPGVTADELAAEATRRLELLQQMAMAANQATTLDEAISRGGHRPARAHHLVPGLRVRRRGRRHRDRRRLLPPRPGSGPTEPDPELARRSCASGDPGARPVLHPSGHAQPRRVPRPARRARRLR